MNSENRQPVSPRLPEKPTGPKPVVHVEIERGKDGRPIGRLSSGKIALLHDKCKLTLKPGEVYRCNLIFEQEKKALVFPVELIKSVDENLGSKFQELKEQGIKSSSSFKRPFKKSTGGYNNKH